VKRLSGIIIALALAAPSLLAPSLATADTTSASSSAATPEYHAKKDLRLAYKAEAAKHTAPTTDAAKAKKAKWRAKLDKRIGKKPVPIVNVYNTWTHEYLVLDAKPEVDVTEKAVDKFLRCHFTNEPADMDQRVFEVLAKAADKFKADRINIVSGFRSDKYNLILRKKGRGVARNSQHTKGKAIDFRIPGVSTARLHSFARTLRLGGVGFYPSSGFIHVDCGPVRFWTGR
jgi:uncharacterized protein YcbK (DUF882 family)